MNVLCPYSYKEINETMEGGFWKHFKETVCADLGGTCNMHMRRSLANVVDGWGLKGKISFMGPFAGEIARMFFETLEGTPLRLPLTATFPEWNEALPSPLEGHTIELAEKEKRVADMLRRLKTAGGKTPAKTETAGGEGMGDVKVEETAGGQTPAKWTIDERDLNPDEPLSEAPTLPSHEEMRKFWQCMEAAVHGLKTCDSSLTSEMLNRLENPREWAEKVAKGAMAFSTALIVTCCGKEWGDMLQQTLPVTLLLAMEFLGSVSIVLVLESADLDTIDWCVEHLSAAIRMGVLRIELCKAEIRPDEDGQGRKGAKGVSGGETPLGGGETPQEIPRHKVWRPQTWRNLGHEIGFNHADLLVNLDASRVAGSGWANSHPRAQFIVD